MLHIGWLSGGGFKANCSSGLDFTGYETTSIVDLYSGPHPFNDQAHQHK
jgi:hypothetical protein